MTKNNAVLIFAKWPEMGKTKTRIADETSAKFAFDFTMVCLDDLIYNLKDSDYYDLIVGVDNQRDLNKFRENYGLEGLVIPSNGFQAKAKSQSVKFDFVFSNLLSKYSNAILIPMDIPFFKEEDMISSFVKLKDKQFVLGPEYNGGVYLIGIRAPYSKDVFKNVAWSTPKSFDSLLLNCEEENTEILKYKSDFNLFQEVLNNRDLISANCPNLNKFLIKNGYDKSDKGKYIDYDTINLNVPVVSGIVRRNVGVDEEILIQTRYKPTTDKDNTGKIEIPNGLINKREPAYLAVIREIKEETGLDVEISKEYMMVNSAPIHCDFRTVTYNAFSITQQLMGGRAYLGINFICDAIGGELRENMLETRNPRWISLSELKQIIETVPESVFPFNLPTLKQYLSYKREVR